MGSQCKGVSYVSQMVNEEIDLVGGRELQRYSCKQVKGEGGKGVSIVWFRNDLRILDNEALFLAWKSSESVLPVYCVDPWLFGTTHYFGFPKTGAYRAQFLVDSLDDLRKNLLRHGLNLLICYGKPEDILPSISEAFGAHTIYAQKETCSEEIHIENLVRKGLKSILLPTRQASNSKNPKLQLIWGSTLYHLDDLPFSYGSLPDVYTQFRKSVESKCKIRSCFKVPEILGPLPAKSVDEIDGWGCIPSLEQLGIQKQEIVCSFLVRDMGIDWRMGAEWFESWLVDYDPCSNYGNWTYGAGVGNDPREDRYFSIPKQAQAYDPEGKYVACWLPELRWLPKDKRHFPGRSYINQVVP